MAEYPLSIKQRVGAIEACGGPGNPATGGLTLMEYDDILFGFSDAPAHFDTEGFSRNLADDARAQIAQLPTLKERRAARAALRDQLSSGGTGNGIAGTTESDPTGTQEAKPAAVNLNDPRFTNL